MPPLAAGGLFDALLGESEMLVAHDSPRPKILIVEDSYLTAEAVGDLVKRYGCEVAGAVGRVETGVEFLRKNDVDAAVVDIDLRGTASFPICDQLRKRDIPFVFLTGYDKGYAIPPEFRGAARLSKPVDDREFETALTALASAGRTPSVDRGNLVLDRLPLATWRLVLPRLERVAMAAQEMLERPGGEIHHVYFPVAGLVSIRACSAQGKRIEVGLIGRDGLTGIAFLLGRSDGREIEAIVQHPGFAWRISVSALAELRGLDPEFDAQLLRSVDRFISQLARNALATGYGTIEQRLARRLLMTSIRLGTKSLALTHDSLSRVLAVRRSGVTVALHMLESRGLIRARRNLIEILNFGALARAAGENCWTVADFRFTADD
ncbi:response regulator [Reyranella sp.]|uniref:response regulator n=1 Tax=Reyranella sp. TaxID=1929291 RepID=UPI002F91D15B